MIKDNIKTIIDFFKLVKGNKIWIFLLFLGSFIGHLSNLLIPVFSANIIYYVTLGNAQDTYFSIALLALTYIVYNGSWYLNYVSYSCNFSYSYRNLREKIMEKIFTYDLDFTMKISKGEMLNTINSDTANLSEMIDKICEIIVVFIKVIIMLFIFLRTNWMLGILVIFLECLYLKTFDYCNIKSTRYLMGQQKYRDKLTENLSQILNGLSEIKTFNIYNKIKQNFNTIANKWTEQYRNRKRYADIRDSLLPFIIDFGKVILYFILACLTLKGYYQVNTLILLISYYETIMEDTEDFMDYSRQIREWSVSISRIKKIMNYSSKQQIEFGINDNNHIKGLIELKHVSFTYPFKNQGNIKNITFTAEPNKITALVGYSGSGKSTIINLLLRKYKINQGEILIDKVNIYDYSESVYSKNIVAVNQTPFIFTMSIRKNLSLVDSNIEHQIEACKRVGIHDYIISLPKGYNTILTENATNFSGGQRQLLSIARTLLSKAEILIFDEVTSSLDTLLVEKIKEIFEDLKKDHTVILITHKKDVMKIADQIIVLNKGKLVGIGSHDELISSNKYYIDLQTHNYSSFHKKVIEEKIKIEENDE